jgi:hypothetical protein
MPSRVVASLFIKEKLFTIWDDLRRLSVMWCVYLLMQCESHKESAGFSRCSLLNWYLNDTRAILRWCGRDTRATWADISRNAHYYFFLRLLVSVSAWFVSECVPLILSSNTTSFAELGRRTATNSISFQSIRRMFSSASRNSFEEKELCKPRSLP